MTSPTPTLDTAALRVHAPKRVTIRWLLRLDACPGDWQEAFRAEWPDGAPVAPESLLRARELGMDIGWLASRILMPPAWAGYREATAAAWAGYREARAPAWAAYEEARAPALVGILWPDYEAWAGYREATAAAWAAYKEARAPASAAYQKAMARALVGILWPNYEPQPEKPSRSEPEVRV